MSLDRVATLEIRPIERQDEARVLEVYRQCEDFLSLGPEPKASPVMVRKDIAYARSEGARFCGIFAANGKMMGAVTFLPSHFERNPQLAFLSLLMIAAPFRNQGIGTAIVKRVEEEIRRNPVVTAILSAVQVNSPQALRFWERNGYCPIGEPQLQPDQTTTVRLRKDRFTEGAPPS